VVTTRAKPFDVDVLGDAGRERAPQSSRAHGLGDLRGDYRHRRVVDGYFARHRVKPGMTGWAQVNGWRGETVLLP
jgi:hypothetical protein